MDIHIFIFLNFNNISTWLDHIVIMTLTRTMVSMWRQAFENQCSRTSERRHCNDVTSMLISRQRNIFKRNVHLYLTKTWTSQVEILLKFNKINIWMSINMFYIWYLIHICYAMTLKNILRRLKIIKISKIRRVMYSALHYYKNEWYVIIMEKQTFMIVSITKFKWLNL